MTKNFILVCFLLFSILTYGQRYSWQESPEPLGVDRLITPGKYRTLSVDFEELKTALMQAPSENDVSAADSPFLLELPHPDGGSWLFSVVESSVMAPELQDKFPEIRTFVGQGRGDYAHATLRMDFTPKGFHAQVLMAGNSYYIDPYAPGLVDVYICYSRQAFYDNTNKTFPKCSVDEHNSIPEGPHSPVEEHKHSGGKPGKMGSTGELKTTNGTTLRTYDLALACTGEYAQFHGGTVPDVMAAMVTSMNRVNGVFERDMSLRMIMVPDNDNLIFLNSSTDPYSNGNGGAMLGQNQTTCDNIIGSSNYDIGHVFSTGGGGVAYLGSVCTSNKAGGVTGQNAPIGDPFDIDYVAHEMGHQWGANHTQNNGCNRVSSAAYEPGSASTIMGYAGICSPNLQSNSDDHFHNHSFNEMYDFSVTGFGNTCASPSSTGNTPPSVSLPAGGFYIPVETPFELSASASDPNGDLLTYCWEQYDTGPSTAGGDNDLTNPSGNAPIFRSWSPTTDDTRVFPRLSDLVNNTTVIGEHLPTYSRDLTFRCTVRDNRAGGGGVTDEEVAFQATDNAGPFLVTAPNTPISWSGGTTATVTWDVANTNNTPVNCSNVDIFLSLDGGFTYPQTLATNVPNNGSANVTVPQVNTTQARVKVKASNNIFFDISNQDFTIAPGFDYDVALLSIDEPIGDVCNTLVEPVITIQNIGSVTMTSLQINYNLNGNPDETYNWTGTLTSNSSTQVTLPAIAAGAGGQALNVVLLNPNGQVDEDNSNNSGSQAFNVIQLTGESLPVSNDFEGAFPGTDWSIENPDGSLTWTQEVVANDVNCNSGNAAFMEFFNYNAPGEPDDLVTPTIDLSGTNAPELTFDYAYARYNSTYFDRMQVQILVGCDENWTTLWDKENLDLATAGSVESEFSPGCGDWSSETIDLTAYVGEIVQIRFRGITGWGNNLYLDNVLVDETSPACSGTPTIGNVSPTTYNCSGGQTMIITGSNFCAPVSVTVDGNNAVISSSSETQIEAVIPAGSGTADVVVTTSFGNSAAVPVNYAAPVIASVAPTTLPCAGGATLTITGSNLCDASLVTVGGTSASNLVQISTTGIQVTAPAGSGLNVPVQVTTPSGTSNTVNVNYAAPVIASVAPTTLPCAGGTTLTITGSNLCDASLVTVGGNSASNLVQISTTEIQVTAPAGSGLNVPVQVTTPSGTSNTVNVNYAAPVIASVAPTTLPCAGGTTLTITGSYLCDASLVTVGGNSASNLVQISTTEIQVTAPAGSGLNVPVQVTTPSGTSNTVNVNYAAPVIASVAPTTLPCAGGATLTITGSYLCDASLVTVGGNSASNLVQISTTEIQVTAPAGSGLNVSVQVTTPSGTSNTVNVNYAAPVIASVAPTTLPCAGGATLTITGSNLCDASLVTVGGNSASNLVQISTTEIQVTAPAGSGLNVPVQVTTPSGTSNTVNVNYAAPVIASVAPTTLPCAGGTTLTITGSDFCNASSVTVGGVVAPITTNTANQLLVTSPAGSGTNVAVQVTTPSGTSNALNVDYAAPVIASVAPTTLPCAGGTTLTITGSYLCDASLVTVGGNSASNLVQISTTEIQVTAPAGSGLNVPVQVTTPSGTSNSVNVNYAAPVIASVAPTTLPCAGGTTLTITGSDFCNASSVTVGGVVAPITTNTANQLLVTSPAGSGTNVAVQVTTPSGTSNALNVDYAAPVIASVAPTELPCDGGATLTLTGSDFCDATSVTVGGVTATNLVVWSSTSIEVTSPAGSGTNVAVQVTTPSGQSNVVNVDYAPCDPGCVAGEYDDNGICTICPPGYYCPGDGNSYPCSAGTYQSASGATACIDCEAGSFSSTIAATSCQSCPVGTFQSETGATECVECAAGTSQSQTGQTSCVDCPVGTFSSITGASSCTDCPAGTANNETGQIACTDCPPGSFSSVDGSAQCDLCPADTYSDVSGSTECLDCPSGSTSDPGAVSCEPCGFDVVGASESATPGFANGTATALATGGIEPYSYLWDDSFFQTTATAVGLFPGTYTCTVTDAADCTEQVTVVVNLFTGVPLTQVSTQYCNTGGYALTDFIGCDAVQNADAYRWELVVQGGSALPEYTRYNNKYLRIQWVTGTQPGMTYEVRVKARVSGEWGEYGSMCTITTSPDIPTTELRPEYHPTNNSGNAYALCDFAIAYGVANATNYRWRFDPDTDPNNGNEIIYTRGTGNPATRLSWVNGLAPGNTYYVAVTAELGGTWGDYGTVHAINLDVPTEPIIRPAFCNQTMAPNSYVLSSSVCAADFYQFQFEPVGGGPVSTRTSGNYVCFLSGVNPSLVPGDYNVRARVSQGGVMGNYGESCVITISGPGAKSVDSDAGFSQRSTGSEIGFFPNPSDGSSVRLTATDLENKSHSVLILVSDMYGKRIETIAFASEGQSISQLISFDKTLSTGIYLVQVVIDGSIQGTERMIVNR